MKRRAHRSTAAAAWSVVAILLLGSGQAEAVPFKNDTVTFEAPDGWAVQEAARQVALVAPEGDLTFRMVETGEQPSAAEAVRSAYASAEPKFSRKLRTSVQQPGREGWDEIWDFSYETSPNEKLAVGASAFRRGSRWTVLQISADLGTFNKRSGAARTFFDSIRPAGYARESFAGRAPHKLTPERIAALKEFVSSSMKVLGVPGVALAFIQDGKIVDEGGLGVRELGRPDPVGAHTRFMIASNTKGMTTLLLAKLVDEGKLRWDEPVVEAFPRFRLADPATTRSILVRHLVCACTGMPRQDLEWIMTGNAKTPAIHVFELLDGMRPTSGFGEMYQYSNLLAAAAGYVGAYAAYPEMEIGAAYDRALREKIWIPLGMRETTFDNRVALAGDHASPHGDDVDGRAAVAKFGLNDSIAFARPAGGAWSTAHDMALYALNELNEGRLPGGAQLVSRTNLLERRQRGVRTSEGVTYGMGLENHEQYGVRIINHGGSMAGYKTDWIIIPEAGVGLVILTNSDNGRSLLSGLGRRLLEVLYDGKLEAAGDIEGVAEAMRANEAAERSRLTLPADPPAVSRLAKHYMNKELGRIDVRRVGAAVVFDFGSFSSQVATRRNDDGTISYIAVDPSAGTPAITARAAGAVDQLVIRDAQHEYVYLPTK